MGASVRQQSAGHWLVVLPALGVSTEFLTGRHCSCPACGGTDRFRFDNKLGNGTWICSQCGAGDGVQLVIAVNGWSFRRAAKEVEEILRGRTLTAPMNAVNYEKLARSPEETVRVCAMLWQEARLITERDPAWLYLRRRGIACSVRLNEALRFHPRAIYVEDGVCLQMPAILAAVSGPDGKGVNILRTYLTTHGEKANLRTPRKLMAGKLPEGSAIRLSAHKNVLAIAEGVETALSATELFGVPCWAAINSNRLASWSPPAGVTEVVIFGDNDLKFGGQAAAWTLARQLERKGLQVHVEIPQVVGEDWNDVALAGRRA